MFLYLDLSKGKTTRRKKTDLSTTANIRFYLVVFWLFWSFVSFHPEGGFRCSGRFIIHIYIYVCGGRFACLNAFVFGRVSFACLNDETTRTAKYNVCNMLYNITCCTTF